MTYTNLSFYYQQTYFICKSLESVTNPFVEVMENEYKSLKNYEKSHGKSWILNVNKVYEPCVRRFSNLMLSVDINSENLNMFMDCSNNTFVNCFSL